MLGPRAQATLEPRSTTIGALVRVPDGLAPASVGLQPFVPGLARLRGTTSELLAFADAHPDLPLEVAPPPHLLLDLVGEWTKSTAARLADGADGEGVLIGIVDTGIDFTLADFNDPVTGHTRVAWLLDLSIPPASPPTGPYKDLEATYGGTVFQGSDLDALVASGPADSTIDDTVGHGTHVASIAAGNGGLAGKYVGIAPRATLIIARITRDATDTIATDDLLVGTQFVFDRADAMKLPIATNLSIGSDFGPHDGTMAWEQALAAFVGPSHPGRALVVAAGNSGDITTAQVHASVFVPPGDSRSVAISSAYGGTTAGGGQVQVWVTMRGDADLAVGLSGPDGTWISPVLANQTGSLTSDGGKASVYNGASVSNGQIPSGSQSALVLWAGTWSSGTYTIDLTGHGVADLYVEGTGDAIDDNGDGIGFVDPVREGTINIPATHPGIIAVGCTVNRASWTSIADGLVSVEAPPLDARGGYGIDSGTFLPLASGDVCWFSSAGPTVTGVPKPEISAPGGVVIAAMSQQAGPAVQTSIFNNPDCPPVTDGGIADPRCMQVDATHAVAAGTSMSSPQAAGAAALLLQKDPTLTEDRIVGLLQAGAHAFRTGLPRFEDQGGPGELDVLGALDALDQTQNPVVALPSKSASWITSGADQLMADGSTPLTAIVQLRTADGAHRADQFDPSRLAAVVELDGAMLSQLPPMQRRAPGVWLFTLTPPPGLGGHMLTVGASFDGAPIVAPVTVPIATDVWTANYPSQTTGSCEATGVNGSAMAWWPLTLVALGAATARRRRRRIR